MLGFCAVMQCQLRPEAVVNMAKEIVPALLVQLDGLKDSYQSKMSTFFSHSIHTCAYTCIKPY